MPAYLDDNGTWYALFYYENFKKEKKRKKKRGFGSEQEKTITKRTSRLRHPLRGICHSGTLRRYTWRMLVPGSGFPPTTRRSVP